MTTSNNSQGSKNKNQPINNKKPNSQGSNNNKKLNAQGSGNNKNQPRNNKSQPKNSYERGKIQAERNLNKNIRCSSANNAAKYGRKYLQKSNKKWFGLSLTNNGKQFLKGYKDRMIQNLKPKNKKNQVLKPNKNNQVNANNFISGLNKQLGNSNKKQQENVQQEAEQIGGRRCKALTGKGKRCKRNTRLGIHCSSHC